MIIIPLWFFLILSLVFVILFFVFTLINAYHLIHTAAFTPASMALTALVFLLGLLTIAGIGSLLSGADWGLAVLTIDISSLGFGRGGIY